MTRRRRWVLIGVALAGALLAALVTTARTLVPPWLHGSVERAASQALGRDLRIDGRFDVPLSPRPRIRAEGVTLANASWGSEPAMVRAARVTLALDLLSLASEGVRVRELEIEDAHLVLEADAEGRGNWKPASEPPPDRPSAASGGPRLDLERVTIRRLELVYRSRPDAVPVRLDVEELEARLDPVTRSVEVRGRGRFADAPWEIAGRLGTLERILAARDFEPALAGRLGGSALEIRGRIGAPPSLAPMDLEVSVSGSDLVAALGHFGVAGAPPGGFQLRSRLRTATAGVDVDVAGAVAGVTLGARGIVTTLTTLASFDLQVEAAGSDASAVGVWLGVRGLPARPFEVAGRLRRADGELALDATAVRVGPTSLTLAGRLGAPPRFLGADLAVEAAGSDLSDLAALTGLRLPPEPFELAARLRQSAAGLAIDAAELRSNATSIRATGLLGEPPRRRGLALAVEAAGPDLSRLADVFGVALPARRFALRGRVARAGAALTLDGVEGRLDDVEVSASGRLVPAPRLAGSDLQLRVAGPDLSRLVPLAGFDGAPAEPFAAEGRLRIEPDGFALEGVEAAVGRLTATLDGRIGAPSPRDGTSLTGRVAGPALSDLSAWGLPAQLPADPFSVAGGIRVAAGIYHADGVVASVGADLADLDGVLGALPDLALLDAALRASGPNLADLERFFAASKVAAPRRLPAGSYEVAGRVRRSPTGFELGKVRARAGETRVRVDGTLGSGKGFGGTDLRLEASGPDLAAALGPVTALATLPAEAFEVSLELAGGVDQFVARRFTARLAGNDLAGRLSLRLDGHPYLDADLSSTRMNLSELLASFGADPVAATLPVASTERPRGERLVSDQPLSFGALRQLDATLRLQAAELSLSGVVLREAILAGELRQGALRIDRLEGRGDRGGRATASLALEPKDDGYRLRTAGRLEDGRLVFSKTPEAPSGAASLDLEFDLAGAGRSLHEIAASSAGGVLVLVGPGRVPNALSDRLESGVLRSLLQALNPFRQVSDHTDLECGIAAATVTGGKATVAPIAARTDKMTVTGRGELDFETEEIDLSWSIKPRGGARLPVGSMFYPYVELGGTLASPSLDLKPIEAVTSMGAAVATGGLTALSRSIYNRIAAEKKVCVDALAKARQQNVAREAAVVP